MIFDEKKLTDRMKNITGNVEGDQIHWKAIQKMLKTRGGLQALGWNGALELLLSM
jgi:hypothetical protein